MATTYEAYAGDKLVRLEADAEAIIARYPEPRSGLLPLLHLVQSEDGYISADGIDFCARILGLSVPQVSAVVTFYTQYKRRPNGTYNVGICTNTLCAIMGGDAIFEDLSRRLGVGHDETTADGTITLERIECNAACDYAPVMMINWEFFDNQTPESAAEVVDKLIAGEPVAPTRGPTSVPTFKQVSRLLAGFDDGRGGEGVGAGPASLVGLELARTQAAQDVSAESAAPAAQSEPETGGEHSSVDRPAADPTAAEPPAPEPGEKEES